MLVLIMRLASHLAYADQATGRFPRFLSANSYDPRHGHVEAIHTAEIDRPIPSSRRIQRFIALYGLNIGTLSRPRP